MLAALIKQPLMVILWEKAKQRRNIEQNLGFPYQNLYHNSSRFIYAEFLPKIFPDKY